MNSLTGTLEELRRRQEGALAVYLTAGYPDLPTCEELAVTAASSGADLLELGVPFSDPMADGPTIQRASQSALRGGATPDKCLRLVERLRARGVTVPIALMGYCNSFLAKGLDRGFAQARQSGAQALVIPDLPAEHAGAWVEAAELAGLDLALFIAPTTSDRRLPLIAKQARGFIYCVALNGVTGARADSSPSLPQLVARARRHTDMALLAGFGISSPRQVAEACRVADGVIVGSAIIDCIDRSGERSAPRALGELCTALKAATRRQGS